MRSYNRVILIGNLTRDIELKYTQGGTAVTEVGLAVNNRRKNQSGEWIDETTFVDVTLWGRTAEVASEYLSKGRQVMIEGRLKLDTWEKDGQKKSKLRVVGEQLIMLGSREGSASGGSGSGGGSGGGSPPREYDESEFSDHAGADSGRHDSSGPPQDDIPF